MIYLLVSYKLKASISQVRVFTTFPHLPGYKFIASKECGYRVHAGYLLKATIMRY